METMRFARPPEPVCKSIRSVWLVRQMQQARQTAAAKSLAQYVRSAVAGSFYRLTAPRSNSLINQQLDYGRKLLQQLEPTLPAGVPRAVIVPHAGYIYSGTAAALAYALLERGRGSVTRAVIVGPTHRVAVRGVACSTAAAFETRWALCR